MRCLTLLPLFVILIGKSGFAEGACPHTHPYCVKNCPEINGLIQDKDAGGITDWTKSLIQRTLDERRCEEKAENKYCCAEQPVAVIVNETGCE